MAQYIDKATVVAEIRKRLLPVIRDKHYDEWEEGQDSERIAILDIIDTLETKDFDEIIKTAEYHAYFAGSEAMRVKLIDKACKKLREGGTGWYLTSEFGEDEINFVKLAEDFRKAMEDE